jgi:hypothetical protein
MASAFPTSRRIVPENHRTLSRKVLSGNSMDVKTRRAQRAAIRDEILSIEPHTHSVVCDTFSREGAASSVGPILLMVW